MANISLKQKIILVICGVFLCVASLEIGLRLGGFIFLSLQELRNTASIKQRGTYRILCLGESTTALGGEYSYPSQLEKILNQRDIGIKFSVINKGIPGTNSAAIASQLEYNLGKYNPDMVITMMGINEGGGFIRYGDVANKKITSFIKSFRTYKLLKLLRSHIIMKARELRIYRPREKIVVELMEDGSTQLTSLKELEEMLKESIQINLKNDKLYTSLGLYYKNQGYYDKAKEMLKKATEINPKNDWAYVGLGRWYNDEGYYNKAKEMLKKATEINPKNYGSWVELGWCYNEEENYDKAAAMFEKAIEVNPTSFGAYLELGKYYKKRGAYDKAEEMFKKSLEINPENDWAYFGLGLYYKEQKKYGKAEEMFEKAIEINPANNKLRGGLALIYERQGKFSLAEEYFRKANMLRLEYYNPITRRSYQKLKEIIAQRGIKLVCIQYPLRSTEPLKKMFNDQEGVIFVDNEKVFREAIKQTSYDEYFTDMFGGDFGHCTPKGNNLLAENIANVILKECFNR